MLKIHKTRTTPFRASANGQVERFNRTLMDAVRCYVSKTPREWDVYIPQIAEALRSSVNRSTGYTPNMLMLGRETTQPVDLVFPGQREEQPQDEYLANLTNSITTAHETARDVLKTTHNIKTVTMISELWNILLKSDMLFTYLILRQLKVYAKNSVHLG